MQVERMTYEEGMKKAFMRGVCALNMEAMNMFHPAMDNTNPNPTPNGSHEPHQTSDTPTPVDHGPSGRGRGTNTMTTTTHRTNGVRKNRPAILVERHTTVD